MGQNLYYTISNLGRVNIHFICWRENQSTRVLTHSIRSGLLNIQFIKWGAVTNFDTVSFWKLFLGYTSPPNNSQALFIRGSNFRFMSLPKRFGPRIRESHGTTPDFLHLFLMVLIEGSIEGTKGTLLIFLSMVKSAAQQMWSFWTKKTWIDFWPPPKRLNSQTLLNHSGKFLFLSFSK